jgi:hypothetical protein
VVAGSCCRFPLDRDRLGLLSLGFREAQLELLDVALYSDGEALGTKGAPAVRAKASDVKALQVQSGVFDAISSELVVALGADDVAHRPSLGFFSYYGTFLQASHVQIRIA